MTDKANTPEEIVDVVNKNDEVVEQSTKGDVNSNSRKFFGGEFDKLKI